MKAGAVGVVLVRVVVGEVREGRGGERGPLVLALPLPLPVTPLGTVPAPGGGRRFAVEDMSLRGMRGVGERLSCLFARARARRARSTDGLGSFRGKRCHDMAPASGR